MSSYKARYGQDINYQSYAQTMYDAVYIVRDGLLAVGYDGQKLTDWLHALKDWDGASGKITILSSGDRAGGHVPKVILNGKTVLYSK